MFRDVLSTDLQTDDSQKTLKAPWNFQSKLFSLQICSILPQLGWFEPVQHERLISELKDGEQRRLLISNFIKNFTLTCTTSSCFCCFNRDGFRNRLFNHPLISNKAVQPKYSKHLLPISTKRISITSRMRANLIVAIRSTPAANTLHANDCTWALNRRMGHFGDAVSSMDSSWITLSAFDFR